MDNASTTSAVSDRKPVKITRVLIVGALVPVVWQVGLNAFALATPVTLVPQHGWIALHVVTVALFVACPLFALRLSPKEAWRTIGGQRVPWMDFTIAVLGGLVVTTLFAWGYNAVVYAVFKLTPDFGYTQSVQDALLFVVLVIALAPIAEELFFRGYYGFLLKEPWVFLLVSGVVWAALHADLVAFLPYLWTGLVFGSMRLRMRSFYPSLALHVLTNGLALAFYFWWA